MQKHSVEEILLRARSSSQGAPVPAIDCERAYLQELGMVGPEGGLTRSGSIAREKAMTDRLNQAFG